MRGTSNLSRTRNSGNELNPVYGADHSARFWQCSWKSPRRIWRTRIGIGKESFERIGLLAIEGRGSIAKDPIARACGEELDDGVSPRLVCKSHRSAAHFILEPKKSNLKSAFEIKNCAFFSKARWTRGDQSQLVSTEEFERVGHKFCMRGEPNSLWSRRYT